MTRGYRSDDPVEDGLLDAIRDIVVPAPTRGAFVRILDWFRKK